MATENLQGMAAPSYVASTALNQYEACGWSSTGGLTTPTDGAAIAGVVRTITSSTASGYTPVATIYVDGMVAKMKTDASTLSAGDAVSVSTAGYATALAGSDYRIGTCVGGSSGSTGRIISVHLAPIGTT